MKKLFLLLALFLMWHLGVYSCVRRNYMDSVPRSGFGTKAIGVAFLSLIGDFSNWGFKAHDYRIICSEKIAPLILTLLIPFSSYCFFTSKTLMFCW